MADNSYLSLKAKIIIIISLLLFKILFLEFEEDFFFFQSVFIFTKLGANVSEEHNLFYYYLMSKAAFET